MEKWMAVALVACVAGCANMASEKAEDACVACEKPAPAEKVVKAPVERTLAEFLVAAKANAEKKGVPFKEARATARFNKMDVSGDGVVTRDEQLAAAKKAE